MPYTISQKILMKYSGKNHVKPGDIVIIEPDRVMSHDNSAFIIKKFKNTGVKKVWNKDKIVIIFDHTVPAKNPEHKKNHDEAREFVKEQQITNFFDTKAGVSHQVMLEKGFVLPGSITMGADSRSTIYGSLGALGIPINRTEMAGIWATGKIWLKVPETIKVIINGKLPNGVYSKDILLKLLDMIKSEGATYKTLEFTGTTISDMSISARMTLSNMAVELGAKAGICTFDHKTKEYIESKTDEKYHPIFNDPDANFEKIINIEVENLEPQIAFPHKVDNIKSINQIDEIKIDQAYLGSCTNGRIEDLQIAANILQDKKIKDGTSLYVYPASIEIMNEAKELGILNILETAGAKIMTASCGPCFGAIGPTLLDKKICISSSNRNFKGRMGSPNSFVYLASPATVAASCIEGKIADPRKYS